MKRCVLALAAGLFFHVSFCQDWQLRSKVMAKKEAGVPFVPVGLLSFVNHKELTGRGVYQEINADSNALNRLINERPAAIQLTVPLGNNEMIGCDLIKTDLGNIQYRANRTERITGITAPVCYQGIVSAKREKTIVTLTISKDYFSFSAIFHDRTIQLGNIDRADKSMLRLYDSKRVDFPEMTFDCGTNKEGSEQAKAALLNAHRPMAPQDKCVYVFVECFDSLYRWRNSSIQQTIDYVYALFNNVATAYLNEQINIKISTINIWTTDDPYAGDTRENALADLSAFYKDNFWGNICVGLDYSTTGRSGLAGDIGRVKGEAPNACPAYTVTDHPFCYNDLNYQVNVMNFPTGPNVTQPQVYLVTHEIGHLLGSHHTQWCGWIINDFPFEFGALDNCANVEGSCSPGPPPASGGTIMSYCVGPGQVTNYFNGFGQLPGDAVRSFVDGNSCIANCPSCPATMTVGNVPVGANHFETSSMILANGTVLPGSQAVFDAGAQVKLSTGFRAISGSRVKIFNDGCGGIR